jgi:hypothetical protein
MGKIRVITEDELRRFIEVVELRAPEIPFINSTPAELDKLASSLINLLILAAKAAGRPARKGGRRSAPAPRLLFALSADSTLLDSIRMSRSPRETFIAWSVMLKGSTGGTLSISSLAVVLSSKLSDG